MPSESITLVSRGFNGSTSVDNRMNIYEHDEPGPGNKDLHILTSLTIASRWMYSCIRSDPPRNLHDLAQRPSFHEPN